ncbi:transcription-repair coupling factor [Candidatus Nitrosacidococcus sp. I8]|uniref:transcription-repair coupling factor n=1 Tax=Candidatus Nitrosacidococcus sp. I8 TaxID=2942908 RepID=UPI0022264C49|nr:transcription-repair coupling factor [Candidatus Nitrosacidococcus sp. I8]CAH9018191.1 Transcription-repair-coupling factor [Candidatus Nitrosacidococcus sp. I8]
MLSILDVKSLVQSLPKKAGDHRQFGQIHGSSFGLTLATCIENYSSFIIGIVPDTATASRIGEEIKFYLSEKSLHPVIFLPDWETLPYENLSPHQDIISEKLETLYQLPRLTQGILIVSITTLMQLLPPQEYLESHSLLIKAGDIVSRDSWRDQLVQGGYRHVTQVMEHSEFAIRGSIIDIFPTGSKVPYRIDLFDDTVDTLRSFNQETQKSLQIVDEIRLLPAREFPLTKESIQLFQKNHENAFGQSQYSLIYQEVSQGNTPPGIEYYFPFFLRDTSTLFDYLPQNTLGVILGDIHNVADNFWQEIKDRYDQYSHNIERPILNPQQLYLQPNQVFAQLKSLPRISLQSQSLEEKIGTQNFFTQPLPQLSSNIHTAQPLNDLEQFIATYQGRVLFIAETMGRRETLLELLKDIQLTPTYFKDWQRFLEAKDSLGITVFPLDQGLLLADPAITVITESQIFGDQAMQSRRRKKQSSDNETNTLVRDLVELTLGSPVVHEEHGIGRYLGLETITLGKVATEFMSLEYAGGDKLYVPIASLHLISRYTGASAELAPFHKLGSGHWEKAKRKAKEQISDIAAKLLAIYAQRAARTKTPLPPLDSHYTAFARAFPFEETPDQTQAIEAVIGDLTSDKPMDRLICGDVGFGKTEVAMRAAFIVAYTGKQVAVVVPTTLLAQQHYQSFKDRFAGWPIKIEVISRFASRKEQEQIIQQVAEGKIDIIIGTHKLLQKGISFNNLGLVVIDEEHRFGVQQKERMKALRAEVDILTLTATPIPRTLHLSLSGIRDLSIIATPPARRLAVKTFVQEWNNTQLKEAILREIRRGGQVYFLHNEVETIHKMNQKIQDLLPEAKTGIAHGQMPERELEQVMINFYHGRFNVLICTTIIETGIDIPNANTIIIHRADKFGLAQLYQLRGRVGRSHHRAYAYLIIPPKSAITKDAVKRLDAIESLEELGTGFTLATHDMEIRGAGELLGEGQSGQIQEIGFSMYHELLERAIQSLKSHGTLDLDQASLSYGAEINLHTSALIPEDFLPDVHTRLVLYKRIAAAKAIEDLNEIQVEIIDRFGLLPPATKTLFAINELRLKANQLGISKIDAHSQGGRIHFNLNPTIDPVAIINLIQQYPEHYKLEGQEKLLFKQDLPDPESRLKALHHLLDTLAIKKTSSISLPSTQKSKSKKSKSQPA